jgi:predicted thioesterase/GNAT superfamily N-acetyltransferase
MPLTYVVTSADTALALGSGDVTVLATPRLIAWLEAATVDACPDLAADETSVGTRVDIEHLLASPLGARVDAIAELVHRDGRLLRFAVTAHHDVGGGPVLIAQGQVTRVVVRREPFLARVGADLVIREALPEELPAVGELRVKAYVAGYGMATEEVGYADVLRDAPGQAADAEILVALRQGELVGTVAIVRPGQPLADVAQPGEVEFRFMAVAPHAWRQGIAQVLLEAVTARAAGQPVVCSVIKGNEPAARLCLAHGFIPIDGRDHEPVPGVRLRVFVRSGPSG